jgi:hypothetical protein
VDRESGSYSRSAFNDDCSRFRRIALSLEGIEEHPPGRNPKEFKFVNHHGRWPESIYVGCLSTERRIVSASATTPKDLVIPAMQLAYYP